MGIVVLLGVPGAGKSTLLKSADLKGRPVVNYGDLMLEIAKEKFGIEHRDQIRKLDTKSQSEVQALVAKKLSAEKRSIILDTHCSINTPRGYLPGLPFALLSKLSVELLVLVLAPAQEILQRRKKDMENNANRVRELDLDGLLEHENINRSFLAAYSAQSGAPAAIIINRDGKLAEAAARLSSLL